MDRDRRISRALSKLLRHEARNEGLQVSPNGYVSLEELLQHKWLKSHKTTAQDVQRIVTENAKQRFKLRDGMICALQGHSMDLEASPDDLVLLQPSELPHVIVHGTFRSKLGPIRQAGGLSPMGRHHVHFATGVSRAFEKVLPAIAGEEVVSGMRSSCQVAVFLNVEKLRESELPVYRSGNGVILIAGDENGVVSLDLFDRIVDVERGDVHI